LDNSPKLTTDVESESESLSALPVRFSSTAASTKGNEIAFPDIAMEGSSLLTLNPCGPALRLRVEGFLEGAREDGNLDEGADVCISQTPLTKTATPSPLLLSELVDAIGEDFLYFCIELSEKNLIKKIIKPVDVQNVLRALRCKTNWGRFWSNFHFVRLRSSNRFSCHCVVDFIFRIHHFV